MSYILLVDDDVDSRDALARYMKRAGHRVSCATNGQEAMTTLVSGCVPDIVILDARMPEMDGVSFLEAIRCYLRWQNLPVVLLTAFAEGVHIRKALELGVRKTFLKANFRMNELLAHVEACEGASMPDGGHDDEPPRRSDLN